MQKIGIFGGTFDPIHNGHLIVAERACESAQLDKVVFVPAYSPPHKQKTADSLTVFEDRYNMTVLAIAGNERFVVSDIERRLEGLSYTINTINELKKNYPKDTELYFITGMDAICDLLTWRHPEQLLCGCNFLVARRKSNKSLQPVYDVYGDLARSRITIFDSPLIEISATDIRERLQQGKSIKYFMPTSVEKYIYDNKLYD
ncbi:MAG: nicotinate-nucleotide adenylyltransferase [Negativicutes bacterium]|jgi:nicotinate-nucleotide adenylyltransferase